jgi:single-stranded DNA-binding protein
LDTVYSENNHIILVGKVTSEKRFSHEIYGEKFYIFDLSVPRLSGNADIIPITISERLMVNGDLPINTKITVEGQFRSYNSYGEGRNKLVLTVFAKNVTLLEDQESEVEARKDFISNEVTLVGYICKKPVYRQTPFGREIADILLAVNRAYSKSDYIPCIAWGRTARFCENMEVGTEVKIVGRVQSRQYEKKHEDGTIENKVAYEVSVGSLEVIEKKDSTAEAENKEEVAEVEENKEAI